MKLIEKLLFINYFLFQFHIYFLKDVTTTIIYIYIYILPITRHSINR
jgi:hypothetical protein